MLASEEGRKRVSGAVKGAGVFDSVLRRSRGAAALSVLVALVAALVVAGCGGGNSSSSSSGSSGGSSGGGTSKAAPIRMAFSTWNGYIGIVIGVKEGFFDKAGVKVSYNVVEDPVQRFNALKAGSLDGIATTPDTFSRFDANGIPTVQVLGLDASRGGDGIVANDSVKTVQDLNGQTVAVNAGSTSQWMLAYVLSQNGMSLKDVKQVNMTSGDAGAAFAAGRVPVAVTWQPWLSKAEKNPNGHVLVSTVKYPTIITDQVGFTPDFVKAHPDSVRAFVKGYLMAVNLLRTDPDKAIADVTDYLGQSPDEVKATMKDVPIWGLDESKSYYGTKDKPGPIYDIFDKSAKFWKNIGEIKAMPDAKTAIDPTFVNEASG
jgi:NitT/TauT family transport system substrate-binding protein